MHKCWSGIPIQCLNGQIFDINPLSVKYEKLIHNLRENNFGFIDANNKKIINLQKKHDKPMLYFDLLILFERNYDMNIYIIHDLLTIVIFFSNNHAMFISQLPSICQYRNAIITKNYIACHNIFEHNLQENFENHVEYIKNKIIEYDHGNRFSVIAYNDNYNNYDNYFNMNGWYYENEKYLEYNLFIEGEYDYRNNKLPLLYIISKLNGQSIKHYCHNVPLMAGNTDIFCDNNMANKYNLLIKILLFRQNILLVNDITEIIIKILKISCK
jgi:hypothetical protein